MKIKMNENKEYLLSVVIPTRNRQYYAINTVKQILSVTQRNVQIVVSDNSDDLSLKKMLNDLGEDRVKYQFIRERISGVDNYGNGISLCDGKYVCCIGDDDGVFGEIQNVVKWADDEEILAVKPGIQAAYIWPNTVEMYKTGCLSLERVSEKVEHINPKKELVEFLKTGCIDFPEARLVKAYHGIVRRDLFEEIYRNTGCYCGGLSPDIYLSVALSLLVDDLVCLDIPLTIFGACKQSTTGDSLNKVNVGKLEEAPHFVGQAYEWSDKVPRFYCGMNIWADSALHALADMKKTEMIKLFSVEHLTSFCLVQYVDYSSEIMENFEQNHGDRGLLDEFLKRDKIDYKKKIFKNHIRNRKIIFGLYKKIRDSYYKITNSQSFVQNGVQNITEAEIVCSKRLHNIFEVLNEKIRLRIIK